MQWSTGECFTNCFRTMSFCRATLPNATERHHHHTHQLQPQTTNLKFQITPSTLFICTSAFCTAYNRLMRMQSHKPVRAAPSRSGVSHLRLPLQQHPPCPRHQSSLASRTSFNGLHLFLFVGRGDGAPGPPVRCFLYAGFSLCWL
jgi:hypothetical protein